jgi:Ca-activated chloride channel family protein
MNITQSKIEIIDIVAPGTFDYQFSNDYVAQVFLVKPDNRFDWVCNLEDKSRKGQWQLQPGNYKLVYRLKNQKSTNYSGEKFVKIESNRITTIKL